MFNFSVLLIYLVTLFIGYAFGNIHGAFLVGKTFKNVDIREHGSKNSGTTNALRVLGKRCALLVFLIDFFKAVIPVVYIIPIVKFLGFIKITYSNEVISLLTFVVAVGVILGHNYPAVLKFKGGKGIACTIGILTGIDLLCGIIAGVIIVTIIAVTRYVSLGSIITVIASPVIMYLVTKDKYFFLLGLFLMVMGIYRHKENIIRLKSGCERKLGEKVKIEDTKNTDVQNVEKLEEK